MEEDRAIARSLPWVRARPRELGLACADALGATLEFLSRSQIEREYGILRDLVGGGWLRPAPGAYTEDTQMARCILESIVECGDVQPGDEAARDVAWYETDPPDAGNLTRQAIGSLRQGHAWDSAGKLAWEASGKTAAGNGGVMRCAPIGLYRCRDLPRLVEESRATCMITHYDPRCWDSCVAVN